MNEEIRYGVKWGECPSCGQRMPVTQNHFCAGKQSHGMDYQSELRAGSTHRVGDIEKMNENKSWEEFVVYANSALKDYLGRSHPDMYYESKEFNKIGLLIEYLKSKDFHNKDVKFCIKEFTLENLESEVKSLKPKEDDEVEEIKELLFEEGGISIWSEVKMRDLARKAIEILRKK